MTWDGESRRLPVAAGSGVDRSEMPVWYAVLTTVLLACQLCCFGCMCYACIRAKCLAASMEKFRQLREGLTPSSSLGVLKASFQGTKSEKFDCSSKQVAITYDLDFDRDGTFQGSVTDDKGLQAFVTGTMQWLPGSPTGTLAWREHDIRSITGFAGTVLTEEYTLEAKGVIRCLPSDQLDIQADCFSTTEISSTSAGSGSLSVVSTTQHGGLNTAQPLLGAE